MDTKLSFPIHSDTLIELYEASIKCGLTPEKLTETLKANGKRIYNKIQTIPYFIKSKYVKNSDFNSLFSLGLVRPKDEF